MQNITSTAGLKNAIQLLEVEQAIKGELVKEQFLLICESLKPANLLKSTFREITSSSNLFDNILGTSVGLATGFLSKKIVVGTSGNIFKKLFGSLIQSGVSSFVSNHPDAIKSIGQFIFQRIFSKKNRSQETEDRS
jgi:hypothetical protein